MSHSSDIAAELAALRNEVRAKDRIIDGLRESVEALKRERDDAMEICGVHEADARYYSGMCIRLYQLAQLAYERRMDD